MNESPKGAETGYSKSIGMGGASVQELELKL